MLDHLIFNKLKWFNVTDNADSVTANGKNYYACPTEVTLVAGAPFSGENEYIVSDLKVKCLGVGSDVYYVGGGNIPFSGTPGGETLQYFYTTYSDPITVPKTSCKNPIWGDKAS